MDYDWKLAVRKATNSGAGSSGMLSGSHNIRFYRDGDKWMLRTDLDHHIHIDSWKKIPVKTVHFQPIGKALYSKLNSNGETVVDELTKSIIRGDVKITGEYSCVNNLGGVPPPGCPEVEATVPIPIMWNDDVPIYARLSKVKVSRGSSSWYMYPAHIEESIESGDGKERMEKHRIYMCG